MSAFLLTRLKGRLENHTRHQPSPFIEGSIRKELGGICRGVVHVCLPFHDFCRDCVVLVPQ
jgi:hypothetical protein